MPDSIKSLPEYLKSVSHRGRTMLLPALHYAQNIHGWLNEDVQREISEALRVPLADIHGVIEFYTMFYNKPISKNVLRICDGPACELSGANALLQTAEDEYSQQGRKNSLDIDVSVENVPCLGMCEFAPVALNDDQPAGNLEPSKIKVLMEGNYSEPKAKVFGSPLEILKRVGKVDPNSLNAYEQMGGFDGLRKSLTMKPNQIIEMVESFNILGRGGAQFPTGSKWRMTSEVKMDASKKHIVVNADESEPGTFKDRVLLEEDPFSIIEAATFAAYAVGAENGWIFVRGEYPKSFQRLENAILKAREKGYLGKNIFGKQGFNFDIELRLGAGAYICGEETALFEAIEGKRGFPRIKPPFPTTNGLFNQPTVVNNVETLAAALAAFNMGGKEWKNLGTKQSPGTKLFCLSGHVENPGLYEVPFGVSIGELVAMAGGVPNKKNIQGILLGGAAGLFIGPDRLDINLTYEDAKIHDIPIGSGVIMVFDESANLQPVLRNLASFFAHESCGKCFPCQIGTQRQMELLSVDSPFINSPSLKKDKLADIGFVMTETSLCGLGQTASTAIQSAIKLWPELVE